MSLTEAKANMFTPTLYPNLYTIPTQASLSLASIIPSHRSALSPTANLLLHPSIFSVVPLSPVTLPICLIHSLNQPFLPHSFHMPEPFQHIPLNFFQYTQLTPAPLSYYWVSHCPFTLCYICSSNSSIFLLSCALNAHVSEP